MTPRYQRIYWRLRRRIAKAESGRKLASPRRCAAEMGVSRTIVVIAYKMLHAEGLVEGKRGSGTYVRGRGGEA